VASIEQSIYSADSYDITRCFHAEHPMLPEALIRTLALASLLSLLAALGGCDNATVHVSDSRWQPVAMQTKQGPPNTAFTTPAPDHHVRLVKTDATLEGYAWAMDNNIETVTECKDTTPELLAGCKRAVTSQHIHPDK
jgi:hypothetical protein